MCKSSADKRVVAIFSFASDQKNEFHIKNRKVFFFPLSVAKKMISLTKETIF